MPETIRITNYPGQSLRRILRPSRRDRRASVKVHGTLSGRIKWELRNADGSLARSGEQHNLILDRGLDVFGTSTGHTSINTNLYSYFGVWRQYLCLGTGSTAPAASQSSLASEVLRTNADGGFGAAETTATYSQSGGTLTGTFTNVKAITFTASYNLTEFGFSDTSTSGNPLVIRELFRDESNNPITLSVQSGQQLKLLHVLTITLPFAASAYNLTITGLNNNAPFQGSGTFFTSSATFYSEVFLMAFNPAGLNAYAFRQVTGASSSDPTAAVTAVSPGVGTSTLNAYASGSYTRSVTTSFATSSGNSTWYGIYLAANNSTGRGYKFIFSNPASFVKASTNTLTFTYQVSWGRAS